MNQATTSYSIWDLAIVTKSPSGTIINVEEAFFDCLHLFREGLSSQSNLNKYKAYTFDHVGIDEDSMRIASKVMEQISFLEKRICGNQCAVDAYNIGVQIKLTLDDPCNRVSSRLKNLASSLKTKGRDGPILVKWHKDKFDISTTEAQSRVLRDFFASVYFWQFIAVRDPTLLDACGSLLCLTTAVDYAGAADDSQCGDVNAFLAGANDGIRTLNGTHITVAFDDIIKVCSFMRLKDLVTSDNYNKEYLTNMPNTLTPSRFMELRWSDAAMAPYHRVIVGCSSQDMRIECDIDGTPFCVEKCAHIRRAVDSIIRYDEIADILSDIKIKERFNEVLVAFAFGGHRAIRGYAEAVASVIEDVLSCSCDADGHQWAANLAIGSSSWYALVPRYQILEQVQLAAEDKKAKVDGMNLQWGVFLPNAMQKCKLSNQITLHTNDWKPVWWFEDESINESASTLDVERYSCSMCKLSATALIGRISLQSRALAKNSNLLGTIYDLIGCLGKRDESGSYECVCYEAHDYAMIWQRICLNLYNNECAEKAPETEVLAAATVVKSIVESFCLATWKPYENEGDVIMALSVELFTSLDKAMRDTYNTPIATDGIWRRQLLMGAVSTFLELSPVRSYASVCEYAFGEE